MAKSNIMKSVKAARGLDRARHFESGGTLVEWMGGPRLVVKDKKKLKNKKRCRQKIRQWE